MMSSRFYPSFLVALGCALLACLAHAESITIGGTGTAEPLMRQLFDEYRKSAPQASLTVVAPPLGSSGGIRAVSTGRIDLAVSSSPPPAAEQSKQLGRTFQLADTPLVLASSDGQRKSGFTLDELAQVYAGRKLTWDNGTDIRLVLRTLDDSDSKMLASMSAAMAKAVHDASRRPGMVTGLDDQETLRLIERTPGSLGPTNLGMIRSSGSRLIVFPVNKVMPSLSSMKDGSYPWRKTLWVVLPLQPSPAAMRFADFLRSETAKRVMRRLDYLPVDQ